MIKGFDSSADLELLIGSLSLKVVAAASLVVITLILLTALTKSRSHLIFGGILLTVLSASTFLVGSTIYLNQVSSSKGPVHWHADFEIWACGNEVNLADPTGRLSNKIGTPTLHEHNDKRIHQEGVVVHKQDASLGKFFRVIGGELAAGSLVVPTNDGKKSYINGQNCAGKKAELQVFVYSATKDKYYRQTKLADPASYIMSPMSTVPPGDCVIFEFGEPKDRTEKMCSSWQVALQIGKLKGELK